MVICGDVGGGEEVDPKPTWKLLKKKKKQKKEKITLTLVLAQFNKSDFENFFLIPFTILCVHTLLVWILRTIL